MSRSLWFLERRKPVMRDFYPVVSGASVDDDDDNEDEDSDDDDDSNEKDSSRSKDSENPLKELTSAQQAALNKLVGDARKEGRTKGEEDALSKAEKDRLKSEGKYKEINEELEAKVKDLEPKHEQLSEEYEALKTAVAEYIKPTLDKLPKLTRSLIADHSPLKQLQLLTEHLADLEGDDGEESDSGDTTKPARVPKSNTGKREKKEQPLGKSFTTSNQKRIKDRIAARTGSTP